MNYERYFNILLICCVSITCTCILDNPMQGYLQQNTIIIENTMTHQVLTTFLQNYFRILEQAAEEQQYTCSYFPSYDDNC